ncbi:MAG: hypothetical protein K2X28_04865 [Alphaproteobacteria bacterium]|nr:hypothetical protein [Alphaproteobacteria bacterium]
MSKSSLRVVHENDVESYKKWLSDNTDINVLRGLCEILFNLDIVGPLHKEQTSHFENKLIGKMKFAGISVTALDGIVTVDDVVTLEANFYDPYMLQYFIRSRPKFVKLMYQYISYFSDALYEAYKEVTGESLILDDLSEVREFYKNFSSFDSWTAHQLCAYISHSDPEALDLKSENPESYLPDRLSRIFTRSDLYEKNLPLVKAALLGGGFEFIHLDRDNWAQSTLKPKKGLEWATQKGIDYHPVLDEYLLTLETTPVISSGYTTPYLEMMLEVIRELGISRENQVKKEAVAALFAKKLNDHKLTPPSQKLADAMATLVHLPESQQGRAKHKG